jgi:protein TonB
VRVQVTTLSHELSVGLKPSAPWASRDRIQAPRQLQGYNPHYSSEALRLHVEGTMYVRCAIRLSTRVEDCAILQGLPAMNDNVKFAYEQRRYAPAVIDGVPTEVDFVFRMTIAFE